MSNIPKDIIHIDDTKYIYSYDQLRSHFLYRLLERYHISLSEEEYDKISKDKNFIFLWKLGQNTSLVWVKMKGQYVLCIVSNKVDSIRARRDACLSTVLHLHGRIPVPAPLQKVGFDPNRFEKEVNKIISESIKLSENYRSDNEKDFFLNQDHPLFIKCVAKAWAVDGDISVSKIVTHLIKHYGETILKLRHFLFENKITHTCSKNSSIYFKINNIEYRVSEHSSPKFLGFNYIIKNENDMDEVIVEIKNRI